MSDILLLFHDYEDDYFVVLNPITKTVDRVVVPDDFPEVTFEYDGDYDCKITTDAAGYNIVYHQIVDDELCCFQYDRLMVVGLNRSLFVWIGWLLKMKNEEEIVLNILDEDLGEVLYTLFYRAGNDVPVYKVTSPTEYDAESVDLDDDEEFIDEEEFTEAKSWHYCGGLAVFMKFNEKRLEKDDYKSTMNAIRMSLFSRNKDGTEYEFRVRVEDLLPGHIELASLSMKELDGVLYFSFQTDSFRDNVAATTYVYSYLIERLEFPPLDNGNRHSRAVFTRRLMLPEP